MYSFFYVDSTSVIRQMRVFIYDGDEQPEEFYIGIANFSDPKQFSSYIYDWRAPISSLFYDYDKGSASYEAPGGTFAGEIKSKWQYKIKNGKVSSMKLNDHPTPVEQIEW